MKEQAPRPRPPVARPERKIIPIRPPADPQRPAEVPPPNNPDYSQATPGQLRRAQFTNVARLLSADIGHFMLEAFMFANLLYALIMGEDTERYWNYDVRGLRPDLDEQQRQAEENIQAIWREQTRRRSIRQQLRNP